jgi:hypothetical protein
LRFTKIKDVREARMVRRRDYCLEALEGRNLLTAVGLAPPSAAQVQVMSGALNGVATLGTTTFDSAGDAIVPVTSTGTGTITIGNVTQQVKLTESHETVVLAASGYTKSLEIDGHATITTTNGSTLNLSFVGEGNLIAPGQFQDTFVYTISGGTGQFAGDIGAGIVGSTDGTPLSADEVPFTFDLNGVISTSHASKS